MPGTHAVVDATVVDANVSMELGGKRAVIPPDKTQTDPPSLTDT